MKKLTVLLLAVVVITAIFAGCSEKKTKKNGVYDMVLSGSITELSQVPAADLSKVGDNYQSAAPKSGDVIAILHTDFGDISMRFFPEVAPKAVNNFIALSKAGKYDGNVFHRVINNFMIQGGNYDGTGGESVYGSTFGYETCDQVKNIRGAVAMAHSSLPDSNGSQFYINQKENGHLDGKYTVFGQVYDGMDVVDRIAAVETDYYDMPVEPVVINSVEIGTYQ